jgi:cytochrome c556
MKNVSRKVSLLGGLLVPLLVVSCGQPGGSGASADDSPEAAAYHYREGLMTAMSWKVARLRAMAEGEIQVDEAAFAKGARDVATLAGMITEGFIPNSAVEGSEALPEIWTNWNDFTQKAADLQNAAQALADAAAQNGFEAAKDMVQGVGQGCGGCHRPYRRRNE